LGKWNSVKWNETRRIGAILACFYVARVWQRQLGFLVTVTLANVGRFFKFFQCRNHKYMAHNLNEIFPTVAYFVATLLCKTNTSVTVQGHTCTSCAWNCGGSVSRNTRLYLSRFVASKQSKSQSSWLRDLGCHTVSCISEENPHHQQTEGEADWSLVRPWTQSTVDMVIDQWRKRLRACVRAKGGHFEHSLWTYWLSWFCQLFSPSLSCFAWILHRWVKQHRCNGSHSVTLVLVLQGSVAT